MARFAVIQSSQLALAGGRMDARYWVAITEYLDRRRLPRSDENIKTAIAGLAAERKAKTAEANRLRGEATKLLAEARALTEQANGLK